MADIVCYGACKGDPTYRQEGGVLPCVLCGGSGKLPGPKSPESVGVAYAQVEARARLSHSAIVAGDVDPGPVTRFGRARKSWEPRPPRKPRMTARRRRAIARQEQRKADAQALAAFKASRPANWGAMLDELKAEQQKGKCR
jgi:hypothetical protein